ncbi:MAG TPA: hypothetical protein VND63_04445 [Rhodanobacteraceae bacterium]|nr:hypothetical protein [Rhodanobacteraceae bacterium]
MTSDRAAPSRHPFLLAAAVALALATTAAAGAATTLLKIPGGAHGLGFDDLGYAPALGRVLVPAAQSGALVLVDPANDALRVLADVVPAGAAVSGHDAGTTSADYGEGLLFASDHAHMAVVAVDPRTGAVVARAQLAGGPDYVRYVAPLHQVWVSEPHLKQIERFSVTAGAHPMLARVGAISVPGGPESLVIDATRGQAYSNEWKDHTVTISLKHPQVTARWANSCEGSRGLALDAAGHTLFVGCKEGKVVALDLDHAGRIEASAKVGAGVDIIAWNPVLHHVYAPGAVSATMSVLDFSGGALKTVATVPTAAHAHCVATDGKSVAYVCDPGAGALIVYRDHP